MKNGTTLGLKMRILLIVGLASSLCAGVAIFGFIYFNTKELENGILNKQRTIHTQLSAATDFVAQQGGLREVISRLSSKYSSASQLTAEEKKQVLNQVPIYAALVIGKKNSNLDQYHFRVFSDEPRREENKATLTESEVLKKFEADSDLKELIVKEDDMITTYRPVRLSEKQGCLICHGEPSTSPWKDGTDILGHKMEGWKDGKLHGVFAISQNPSKVLAAASSDKLISPAQWLIGAILAGAVISVLFAIIFVRSPLSSLTQAASSLSEASEQLGSASVQIATSAQSLSHTSIQQASSLEETVATMEELTSMVKTNTKSAEESARLASSTNEFASRGEKEFAILLQSIKEINQDSKKIEEIISLIDDIAFQTNLLALNAAVEAARAGEQGKGFAVVADAVRELAQKSSLAAGDIANLIRGSVAKIEAGSQQAASGSAVLSEIVAAIRKVSALNNEIATASQEQSAGLTQITTALNQLDQVTQQNSAVSEESAAAAEELSSQAKRLDSIVDDLMSTIGGNKSEGSRNAV